MFKRDPCAAAQPMWGLANEKKCLCMFTILHNKHVIVNLMQIRAAFTHCCNGKCATTITSACNSGIIHSIQESEYLYIGPHLCTHCHPACHEATGSSPLVQDGIPGPFGSQARQACHGNVQKRTTTKWGEQKNANGRQLMKTTKVLGKRKTARAHRARGCRRFRG